ncbi:MAG: adenylosuccinate synthetase, partial [Balneolaceae bacterium]|nr:adenylosuccinate synthetase [Balneolaceae bacterium]
DGLEELKLCTSYDIDGSTTAEFSPDLYDIERAEPVYDSMPGWKEEIRKCTSLDALPDEARDYLRFIRDYLEVDLKVLSTGPRRSETIML